MLARSELSKPRMSDVMPTIDVMPMTTPSMVSAGAHLVRAQGLQRHAQDFAEQPLIHV